MDKIKRLIRQIVGLVDRYSWALAVFGFVTGVASFVLVDREQDKFPQLISIMMLLSWGWLSLEYLLPRGVISRFGFELGPSLRRFASQMVHQESLFFVIPFFFFSTSWNSGQLVFTSLLIGCAVISIIDPLYYRWLAPKVWLFALFNALTLFAVLLTTLPIIFHLSTSKSYFLSLTLAILLSLPETVRAMPFKWWQRGLTSVAMVFVLGLGVSFVRAWVPPASLRLFEFAVTDSITDKSREPENSLKSVTVEQLSTGLYAYTAIRAPRGLNERIYHVWRRNGNEVDRIALDIAGGRETGYRAWTHKLNFPPYPTGDWKIHVVTEADQVIGVLRFRVVPSPIVKTRP